MNTISVHASKDYPVIIGSNIHCKLGSFLTQCGNYGKVAIISDTNVWPIYGRIIQNSLDCSGYETVHYTIAAGEESKNGTVFLSILNFLAENKLTRSDCVVALGGGVVGDITGFCASVYLRGISYVQVPTTLLAMVDSSVGGKTAIDLPAGKNLAGAFYQPRLVLCDTDALSTLSGDIFRDGCAEVIKYGVLYDPALFSHLSEYGLNFQRESVISRCVELKRDVVAQDEFDTGARQKLNLGHTIGHAVEARSDFKITHGQAVAIGMSIVTKAAMHMQMCNSATYEQLLSVLGKFGLPVCTQFSAQELFETALSDKKRSGENINLILPEQIGCCVIHPMPISQLESFIEAGL